MVQSTLRPRLRGLLWHWLERHVSIPEETGSPNPGPYRTARFPVMRGLYDLAQKPGVHFFTFCASARVGKTLFSIAILLWWLAERFGPVVWLDPTRKSAIKFSNTELNPFLLACPPVRALAIFGKSTWTTLEKYFRGKFLRVIGSGAEADLHGFQAALAIINESDRCRTSVDRDASSADKIVARTRQFAHTRLIVRNSTPTDELGDVWQNFLKGSQHYCYLPCPHCGQKQRLTFFAEKKEVPFDEDGRPLPDGQTEEEKTGHIRFDQFAIYADRPRLDDPTQQEKVKVGYDLDAVEQGATYVCSHCELDIEWTELNSMQLSWEWRAHNPKAPRDHISAHLWAAYSPFEFWGTLAKEFLEAKGKMSSLIKFWTLVLGLPFIRQGTAIKSDDLDRVIKRTPVRYVQGQLPAEPEILTMTIDTGGEDFWWTIRAWGIQWDHPERPTWSALIDWGHSVSWEQIEEFAGLRPMPGGRLRRFTFTRPDGVVRDYCVTAGLVDSGFEAKSNKKVYEFCLKWRQVFSPYKGADQAKMRGSTFRLAPILDDQLDLVLAWSDFFTAQLYYTCIKDGTNSVGDPVSWYLPVNIDDTYRKHLTSERQVEKHGKRMWEAFGPNHLGDGEKMQEVLRDTIEETLDQIRAERLTEEAKAA